MLQLLNGCHASKFSVHPKNWKDKGASAKIKWYIHYRFHDPAFKHIPKYKYGQLRIISGMNNLKSITERREITEDIIEAEKKILLDGYHPILNEYVKEPEYNYELNPDTPFIKALWKGLEKVKGVKGTLDDMKSVVKGVEKSARQLEIHKMPVSSVSRKYFKRILEQCYKNNKKFSPARHNKYRAYLMKIYKELIQLEVVEINPLRDIFKEAETKKERIMLTTDERKKINEILKAKQYKFWRLIQIFFHSGSRETELMKVQVKHIDLINQRCRYIIMKGGNREVWRPIKNIVIHLWEELIKDAKPDDYIFSTNLIPGPKQIRTDQIGRRWALHVKKKMKIKAGLYSLKHLNTTETMDELERRYNYDASNDVASFNGHKSNAMVIKIYDRNHKDRRDSKIKSVANEF